MKNDDTVGVWNNPELEARVVAMLMGELSDFEKAELEEELLHSPELRLFRDRLINTTELMRQASQQSESDDQWKISSKRRDALLEKLAQPSKLDNEQSSLGLQQLVKSGVSTEPDMRRIQWRGVISIAACLILSLVMATLLFPFKKFSRSSKREVALKNDETVSYSFSAGSEKEEPQRNEKLARLKADIEAQEDKVADKRTRLYKLSKSIGIPYNGLNTKVVFMYKSKDEARSAGADYHSSKRERDRLEILVKEMESLDDERLRMRILASEKSEAVVLRGEMDQLGRLRKAKQALLAKNLGEEDSRVKSLGGELQRAETKLGETTRKIQMKYKSDLATYNKRLEALKKDAERQSDRRMVSAEEHTQFGKIKDGYEAEFVRLQEMRDAAARENRAYSLSGKPSSDRAVDQSRLSQKAEGNDIVWADTRIAKTKKREPFVITPQTPASSMAKKYGHDSSSSVALLPEISLSEFSLDFGDADSFGDGWGEGKAGKNGLYDNAMKEYRDILRLDPYSKVARRKMEKAALTKQNYYRAAYDMSRAQMLMEVDRAWQIKESLKGKAISANEVDASKIIEAEIRSLEGKPLNEEEREKLALYQSLKVVSEAQSAALIVRNKLNAIHLEQVDFGKDTTVREALAFLNLRGRELDSSEIDSKERGVRMKIIGRKGAGKVSDVDLEEGDSIDDVKIGELKLKNVPMGEALRQICQKTGMRFKIENEGVVVMKATDVDDSELYIRAFRVPDDFEEWIRAEALKGSGDPFEEPSAGKADTVQDLLLKIGIPMPEGTKIFHSKERGVVLMRNTSNNLDLLEKITTQLNSERKEDEIKQKALEEERLRAIEKTALILPQEVSATDQTHSTFSLNVSDVSFELARIALLEKNQTPETASIRVEEFVNAFDYGDPSALGNKVNCVIEQVGHPMYQQRNLMRIGMKTGAIGRTLPLRLTILLDHSGSMEREDRESTVLKAMEALASKLGSQDEVTLLSFARNTRLVAQKVKGSQAGKLVQYVKAIPSEGGTNLSKAIAQAHAIAKRDLTKGTSSRIVLMTDGAANLGNADPEALSGMIASMRQEGIAFDVCGIGADGLNDEMLEALTRKGDGRYYFINKPEDAHAEFAHKLAGALSPAAKNVKVQVIFNPERVGNYRLLGFEKHRLKQEDFRNDKVDAAELAAEEAGNALYQVEAKPGGSGDIGTVFVRFLDVASGQMHERSWTIPYHSQIQNIDDSCPSLQLASVAGLLAEQLKFGEAAGIDLQRLNTVIGKLRAHYQHDKKVKALIQMVEKTRR